ncbi:MAG: cytidyltransferase-like domain protein [Gammaproteobacteria bacterium]|jgi:bifunctional NMN adenylyltransferase/nudix hydrolase|nr:cytidyltransferase-like domain protein [Gammaproteobacteria bacterium]
MAKLKIGVFIGRFQPFHEGHLHIIQKALESCDQLILIVGSIKRARTVKNPWDFQQRKSLIEANLKAIGQEFVDRVSILGVEDQMYNENVWNQSVESLVLENAPAHASIILIGHDKDETTYYLKAFPSWDRMELPNFNKLNATLMRAEYFAGKAVAEIIGLTAQSRQFLTEFKSSQAFLDLQSEYRYLKAYKASWAKAPFPPIHVTTDSVVICNQHILLVKRGGYPGHGLWALPGGFLEPKEWVKQGLIRELEEETSIELSSEQLKQFLSKIQVFDNPARAQIGRVITHAGLFQIAAESLPAITANDDAAAVKWFSLNEFWNMSDQMHDDHYYIVKHFLS